MRTTKTLTLGEVKEILKEHFKAESVRTYEDCDLYIDYDDPFKIEVDDGTYLLEVIIEEK